VPEAPRRVPSSDRSFDLTHYLSDENLSQERHPDPSRRRSRTNNFLPPPLERDRPQSRNGVSTSLPSPPRDTSEPTASSRILLSRPLQSSPHPLSFTHRPVSPDDGLGDRNRSPSPSAWNVIGSTITPDDSLPSADSSFASTIPAGIITQADAVADPRVTIAALSKLCCTTSPCKLLKVEHRFNFSARCHQKMRVGCVTTVMSAERMKSARTTMRVMKLLPNVPHNMTRTFGNAPVKSLLRPCATSVTRVPSSTPVRTSGSCVE
jgi:hypothetical protein